MRIRQEVSLKYDQNQNEGKVCSCWTPQRSECISFKFLAVSTKAGARTVTGGGQSPCHEQLVLSHTALTPPQRGHHNVKPHESPEPSKKTQAPSDGIEELTTPSWTAADKSSPQASMGSAGHPCAASTQGSRTYCTPKQLMVFEKAPRSPLGLFFAKVNWTDMTKHT